MSSLNPRGREASESTPFVTDGCRDPSEERTTISPSLLTHIHSERDEPRPMVERGSEDYNQEKLTATHIPWQHKISLMNTLLMGLVALLIPAAVGFLAFLWSYTGGGTVNGTFRRLVVDGWIVQAVTITSVVLRFAVSTAAGIATSMLAALALEVQGTSVRSAASISILRFVNSGPQSLLLNLKHSWKHNWRSSLTVSLLFLTTLLLQFTSTLLASDLRNGILIGSGAKNATNTRITQNNLNLAGTSVSLSGTPREFPLFAEQHSGNGNNPSSNSDTGILLRGLLPFTSSTTRTSIEAYSGQSTILDSRTACVRPRMHEYLSVLYDVKTGSWVFNGTWLPEDSIEGLLPADFLPVNTANVQYFDLDSNYNNATYAQYSTQHYNVTNDGSQKNAYAEMLTNVADVFALSFFESTITVPSAQSDVAWTLSFMPLMSGPVLLSTLDPRYPFNSSGDVVEPAPSSPFTGARLPRFKQGDPVALLTGSTYLFVNITNGDSTKIPPFNPTASANLSSLDFPAYLFATYETGFTNLVLTPRDNWLVFSLPEHPGWEASVSLCYDSSIGMDLQVNLTTNTAISEPSLGVFNDGTNHFGTEQVLAQLDYARNQTDTMILSTCVDDMRTQISQSYQSALSQNHTYMDIQNWVPFKLQDAISAQYFYIMCQNCTASHITPTVGNFSGGRFGGYVQGGSWVIGATQQIFMDAVQTNGNVPLALSDYMTVVARMLYYDTLPYFDLADEAIIYHFNSGLFPRRFTGLTIVLAALFVHVCIIIAITVVFLMRTRVSRIGDAAWQAVAQVQFQDLRGLLSEALVASDGTFGKCIVDAGLGNNIASFNAKHEMKKSV